MAEQQGCKRFPSGSFCLSKQDSSRGTQLLEIGYVSKVGLDESLVEAKMQRNSSDDLECFLTSEYLPRLNVKKPSKYA